VRSEGSTTRATLLFYPAAPWVETGRLPTWQGWPGPRINPVAVRRTRALVCWPPAFHPGGVTGDRPDPHRLISSTSSTAKTVDGQGGRGHAHLIAPTRNDGRRCARDG